MTAQTDLMIGERALDRGAWLINRLDLNYRTRSLEITADDEEEREFRLIFKDFHLMSWEVFQDEYDPGRENVDVIGFDLKEHEGRKTAVLHTDVFEIIVSYAELVIEKDW